MDKKQKLLLEYLISSPDTFALTKSIVKPAYFDPELRQASQFIANYYDQYHQLPTPDQIEAETEVALQKRDVEKDELVYCVDEVEKFCRHKAMEKAILAARKERDSVGGIIQLDILGAGD